MRLVRQPTAALALEDDLLVEGDNAAVLGLLPAGAFDLVYVDPPFNTGRRRRSEPRRHVSDASSERPGFMGAGYRRLADPPRVAPGGYADAFDDYVGWLLPRLEAAFALLAPHGTLYVHLDQRESHYVKVALDALLGRERFLNEIVWAYDFGARSTRRWPAKHDTILVYVATPGAHHFDAEAIDREPYRAPRLAGPEKAARGKLPTDVWWQTIVPTNSVERTGYPTQKPEAVLRRIVQASSRPGGWCLDCFAGSGTLGAVCRTLGRRFVLVDANPEAIAVAGARLARAADG